MFIVGPPQNNEAWPVNLLWTAMPGRLSYVLWSVRFAPVERGWRSVSRSVTTIRARGIACRVGTADLLVAPPRHPGNSSGPYLAMAAPGPHPGLGVCRSVLRDRSADNRCGQLRDLALCAEQGRTHCRRLLPALSQRLVEHDQVAGLVDEAPREGVPQPVGRDALQFRVVGVVPSQQPADQRCRADDRDGQLRLQ